MVHSNLSTHTLKHYSFFSYIPTFKSETSNGQTDFLNLVLPECSAQLTFTYSKSKIETLKKSVKYVQS